MAAAWLLRNSLIRLGNALGIAQPQQFINTSLVSQRFSKTLNVLLYHTSTVYMRSIGQIIRQGAVKPKTKVKGPLSGRPQLKGIVLQTFTLKPKKPNSAQRKCCRLKLSTGRIVLAHIPHEGHTLQEGNVVLVRGGRTKDIGTKVKVIRGKYDCGHPIK